MIVALVDKIDLVELVDSAGGTFSFFGNTRFIIANQKPS